MKIIIAILVTIVTIALARRHQHTHPSTSLHSNDSVTPWTEHYKNMDLRGHFRKGFFVNSALVLNNDNMICSPLSAMLPLAKLALGAEGMTLEELLAAIGLPKRSMIRKDLKRIISVMRYLPGVKLDIASKLYISDKSHLQKSFTNEAKEIFASSADKLNFEFPSYAAQQINSWVSLQTNGVIKELFTPADIPPTTSLVIVNAVYFNGKWKEAFDQTKNTTFHSPKGHKVITMMSRKGVYNYTKSEALGAELIKIPYKGEKASFLVVLPIVHTGLPLLLSHLKMAPEILDSAMSNMAPRMIQLTLPKFKMETELNLNDMYEKVGVKRVFDRHNSELVNILKDEKVYVTKAKHKAYIDVNEYGTKAGAASGAITTVLSAMTTFTFKADHPFLFFILVDGQQLFSGTFVNPKFN